MNLSYEIIIDTQAIPGELKASELFALPTEPEGDGLFLLARKAPQARLAWLGSAESPEAATEAAKAAAAALGLRAVRFLPVLVGKTTIANRLGLSPNTITNYAKDDMLPLPFHAPRRATSHALYLWQDILVWGLETRGLAKLGVTRNLWRYLGLTMDQLHEANVRLAETAPTSEEQDHA